MAKICENCNYENPDNELVCQECGADLPEKKNAPKVKQKQNPAIRTVILIILIAAALFCLFTTIQYVAGAQLTYKTEEMGEDTIKTITFGNSWTAFFNLFKKQLDFANPNTMFTVFRLLSQCCNTFFYLLLTALLGFTFYLVFTKSNKASLFAMVSGGAGLIVIILGFLIGYIVIVNKPVDGLYLRTLPQLTVLVLLPLFAQLPLLALLLPAKEKREKKSK